MPVKPPKDPRYKPVPGKSGSRWMDTVTGQVLTRTQWEKATANSGGTKSTTSSPVQQRKILETRAQNKEIVEPLVTSTNSEGPVPIVEAPAPPPIVTAAYDVTREAADVVHAAAKGMEVLATKIGQGIAQSASYFAQAFLPPDRAFWAPPEACLRQVTEPGARLFARHSHLQVDLGDDGEDIGDLFVGVMACVTAISIQKMQYDQQKEMVRLQYIHDFEVANGPGSYQAAVSASGRQSSPGTQKAANQGYADANQNGRGPGANGDAAYSGNHHQQYRPGHTITDDLLAGHANGHRGPSNN